MGAPFHGPVMSTHFGSVRSFDLGGPVTAGRRWSARCRCGALATTATWSEALGFVNQHLRVSAAPPLASSSNHHTPDLRFVEYQPPVVTGWNGNGHVPRRRFVRAVGALVRVVVSALRSTSTN
jgi:hypothetical protein